MCVDNIMTQIPSIALWAGFGSFFHHSGPKIKTDPLKIITSTVPATLLEQEKMRKLSQKALIIPILNYMDLPNFIIS